MDGSYERINMASHDESLSLYVCGHCKKNTKGTVIEIRKIIASGYANMLCDFCRNEFNEELKKIAIKYLK